MKKVLIGFIFFGLLGSSLFGNGTAKIIDIRGQYNGYWYNITNNLRIKYDLRHFTKVMVKVEHTPGYKKFFLEYKNVQNRQTNILEDGWDNKIDTYRTGYMSNGNKYAKYYFAPDSVYEIGEIQLESISGNQIIQANW